jgi:hypothetical protein
MIPYADFDLAIKRWKARTTGAPAPEPIVASGTVQAPAPPPPPAYEGEDIEGIVSGEQTGTRSGSILVDDSAYEK